MIIDGKHVRGIFVYSDGIEYEKDDFLVSGDCIYICTADNPTNVNGTVSGIDPANDTGYTNFKPYPGSKILSASEFFDYVESGGTLEDKYVSSQSLLGILQGYQFGVGMTGLIEDYIGKDGESSLNLNVLTENPIDNLMLTETLNNGVLRVSHKLRQIVDGTYNNEPLSIYLGILNAINDSTGGELDYYLILRQYTYKTSETKFVRLQEMISPVSGVSVYRYMSWDNGNFPSDSGVISGWRSVYSYSSDVLSKLNALSSFYNNISVQMKGKLESISGSFRFKETATATATTVTELSSGVYTVCVSGTPSGKTTRISDSVTLRINGAMNIYFASGLPGYLKVETSGSNKYKITWTDAGTEDKIESVYLRETINID